MPTYDYECPTCNHSFEVFHKITAEPIKSCPRCGNHVKRLIGGGVGIIFKGSGFYTTDYKKSSAPSSTQASAGENGEKKAKEEKKEAGAGESTKDTKKESSKSDK